MIKSEVAQFIGENQLLSPQDEIIVGLSGGADSVALLLVLLELGYSCKAAHCNFNLRGEDSDSDEAFVKDFCKQLNVECKSVSFFTTKYAKQKSISIEMAARDLRYEWFQDLIDSDYGSKIAIAHHRDDNVETFFLNLTRGAGLKGLTGIQPKNGAIIRPLLSISRTQIEEYLASKDQAFVIDCTNLEDEFARNKIRLHVVPTLEKINSASQANINQAIHYLNQAHLIYTKAIEDSIKRVCIDNKVDIALLLQEVCPEAVLHEIFYPLGINKSQLTDMMKSIEKLESKEFITATHRVVKNRGEFLYQSLDDLEEYIPELSFKCVPYTKDFQILRDKNIAYFDANLVDQLHLKIRKWQKGDFFVPFGMRGKKKLSDYFTDNKFSLLDKESQSLLVCKEDIIWVIGHRTDNRYRITDSTKEVLIVKVK